jgi:hypothetical protein
VGLMPKPMESEAMEGLMRRRLLGAATSKERESRVCAGVEGNSLDRLVATGAA